MPLPWLIGAVAVCAAANITKNVLLEQGESEDSKSLNSNMQEKNFPEEIDEQHEPFVDLGRRIETIRILKRMTQEKCAAEAKISRTALRNLEDGKDTKLSTLWAISNVLQVPIRALFQELQPEIEANLEEAIRVEEKRIDRS